MLLNALEASDGEPAVKFQIETADTNVIFSVWNRQAIAPHIAPRIFQRNFSTKSGSGRGLGTFSMRLFGETYLKGQVSFVTSEDQGTTFSLTLPLKPATPIRADAVFSDGDAGNAIAEQALARR
jgi:signal transduction histidine kinase